MTPFAILVPPLWLTHKVWRYLFLHCARSAKRSTLWNEWTDAHKITAFLIQLYTYFISLYYIWCQLNVKQSYCSFSWPDLYQASSYKQFNKQQNSKQLSDLKTIADHRKSHGIIYFCARIHERHKKNRQQQ